MNLHFLRRLLLWQWNCFLRITHNWMKTSSIILLRRIINVLRRRNSIEKNHEFIRYAVPKGKSLNPYTQEDMTLLMNHINSVKRPGLGNKSPYELVEEDDEDFKALMSLLKMHLIPPDEVHLMPDLFVKK